MKLKFTLGGGPAVALCNSSEHQRALQETGFWGRAAGGCLFLARDTGRILVSLRSDEVQEPNTWSTWGGAIDEGENPRAAVLREVREETGYAGRVKLLPMFVFRHESGFTYYNFLAVVPREFTPQLDWETADFRWVSRPQVTTADGAGRTGIIRWPSPMHPGLKSLLKDPKSLSLIKNTW